MELQKDDLQEQLQHEQKMLKIRRRNLRALEEQEANYGLAVPMEIRNQIAEIKDYIRDHEKRIDELQIVMSEGDEPISEVEYVMHLAEVWDATEEYPKIAHLYRLDFLRLKLHITPEKAAELEQEIRHSLALELDVRSLRNMEFQREFVKVINWMCGEGKLTDGINFRTSNKLLPFWRMLSLEPRIAIERLKYELRNRMDKLIVYRVYHMLEGTSYYSYIMKQDKDITPKLIAELIAPFDNKSFKLEIKTVMDELFPEDD